MLVCFALNVIELDYSQDELAEFFLNLAGGSCSYDSQNEMGKNILYNTKTT